MAHDHSHDIGGASRRALLRTAAAAGVTASLPRPELGRRTAGDAATWRRAAGGVAGRARPAPAARGAARLVEPPARELALRAAQPAGRRPARHERAPDGGRLGPARLAAERARARPGARPAHDRAHPGRAHRQPRASAIPATTRLRSSATRPAARPWAWRFEGHHLSLSVLVAPGHGVAVTPVFFGANPAHVPARPCPRRFPADRRGGGRGLLAHPVPRRRPAHAGRHRRPRRSATSSRGRAASST